MNKYEVVAPGDGLLAEHGHDSVGMPPLLSTFGHKPGNLDRSGGVTEVGDELISNSHVHGISFTGSTAVGSRIAAQAGGLLKKCCVELGGKDALIVLDDADIEHAVNAATFGAFMHQGQICMSVERIIVHEAIADEFTEKLVANTRKLGIGDPHEMGNCIGPVINQTQLDKIRSQVDDAVAEGATILCGGKNNGLYFEPTVLGNVTRSMRVFREETFGPVAPIIRASSDDEAVEIANDSDYGLSSGVMTRDEQRGLSIAQRLRTGMSHINDCSVNDEPHVPFGGIGASGVGRHGGKPGIDTFTELRWITLERGGRHYPPPFLMNP
jgi:aldehyde dehydrogenase (NAD+)